MKKPFFLVLLMGGLLSISAIATQNESTPPETKPATPVLYDCSGLPNWNSTVYYNAGSKVKHQNKAFEAKWWNLGIEPNSSNSDPSHPWKFLGNCDGH